MPFVLNIVMLIVAVLSVAMLNVMAPWLAPGCIRLWVLYSDKKLFYNNLERLFLASLSNLVIYLQVRPEPTNVIHFQVLYPRVGFWPHSPTLD